MYQFSRTPNFINFSQVAESINVKRCGSISDFEIVVEAAKPDIRVELEEEFATHSSDNRHEKSTSDKELDSRE